MGNVKNTTESMKTTSTASSQQGTPGPIRTLVAIPCMAMVPTEFMTSLVGLERVGHTRSAVTMSSLIYDARNSIASTAIAEGYDRILWLDSDMLFEPDLMKRLWDDMEQNNLDYVSALYFMRKTPTLPVVFKQLIYDRTPEEIHVKADNYIDYPRDQLFKVAGSGFGAVLMKTSVIKAVWDNFGLPFSPMMGFGEDISFCWRAAQLGTEMYCDSRIKIGHIGQFAYTEQDYIAQTEQITREEQERIERNEKRPLSEKLKQSNQ